MTLKSLYLACGNMKSVGTFNLALYDFKSNDIHTKTYETWWRIPEEYKQLTVSSFGYHNGKWFINLSH